MAHSYPTKPLDKSYNPAVWNMLPTLQYIKSLAETNGIQINMTLRPEDIEVTLIKKYKDSTIKKQTLTCKNEDLLQFPAKLQEAFMGLGRFGMF